MDPESLWWRPYLSRLRNLLRRSDDQKGDHVLEQHDMVKRPERQGNCCL